MQAPQQSPAGVEPAAPLLQHHLFFAVLPDAAAAHAAADLAQSLIARHDLQAQVRAPSFQLRFDRVLSFARAPRAKRPCVLCGPADGHPGFLHLYEALHAQLWSQVPGLQGVPQAPRITPHMTLCYSRQAVPEQAVPPLAWTVDRFVLLHNVRGSSGPYEVLGEWPLGPTTLFET